MDIYKILKLRFSIFEDITDKIEVIEQELAFLLFKYTTSYIKSHIHYMYYDICSLLNNKMLKRPSVNIHTPAHSQDNQLCFYINVTASNLKDQYLGLYLLDKNAFFNEISKEIQVVLENYKEEYPEYKKND